MTRPELRQRVNTIIEMSGDDEGAHSEEDALHREIIETFCPEWVLREVERLDRAEFQRYCA